MSIICPNLNDPKVKKQFDELSNVVGEDAAYDIWNKNNGNPIDMTPEGKESPFFKKMMDITDGDRERSILFKSKMYGDNFLDWYGDWTKGNPIEGDVKANKAIEDLFNSNPELANKVYEALGFKTPNITLLPNGNLKIIAFRTEKVGDTSKGQYQRGKGLYLSLDKPYPGKDVYTVEIEISPKNLLDRKLGFGKISEDFFIDEKNKRIDNHLDTLAEFKQSLGIKAEIGSIDGALMNELVLFNKDLINQAISSKKKYNPQQKQQAIQLYSQYLKTIFPDSVVKDIVYHGTQNIETILKKGFQEGYEGTANKGVKGFHFAFDIKDARYFATDKGKILSAIVNVTNKDLIDTDEILIYSNDRIHILFSKQDIESFKTFANGINEPTIQKDQNNNYYVESPQGKISPLGIDSESEVYYQLSKPVNEYKKLSEYINEADHITAEEIEEILRINKVAHRIKKDGLLLMNLDYRASAYMNNLQKIRYINKKFHNLLPHKATKSGKTRIITINQDAIDKINYLKDTGEWQMTMYQLSEESEARPNDALNAYLQEFLYEHFGVSITEENLNRTEGWNARVNLLKKLIEISKGASGKNAIPEEAAHIVIEAIPDDHPIKQRLLEDIKETELYNEVYDEYKEAYEGSEDKIAKEALGKALARTLRNEWEQTPEKDKSLLERLKSLLSQLWNYFASKARKIKQSEIEKGIDEKLKKISRDIIKGQSDIFSREALDNRIESLIRNGKTEEMFFQLNEYDAIKKGNYNLSNKIELKDKAIKSLISKVEGLQTRKKDESVKRVINSLKELIEELSKDDAEITIMKFIARATSDINAIERKFKRVKAGQLKLDAKTLMDWDRYLSGYSLLEEINNSIYDELNLEEQKELREVLKDKIDIMNQVKRVIEREGKEITINTLAKYSNKINVDKEQEFRNEFFENNPLSRFATRQEWRAAEKEYVAKRMKETESQRMIETKDLLRKELDVASKDVNFLVRWIDTPLDADDVVMSAMVRAFEQKELEILAEQKKFKDELLIRLEALERYTGKGKTMENMYGFMLEKDRNGNLTQNIVQPIYSEYYDVRNSLREIMYEYDIEARDIDEEFDLIEKVKKEGKDKELILYYEDFARYYQKEIKSKNKIEASKSASRYAYHDWLDRNSIKLESIERIPNKRWRNDKQWDALEAIRKNNPEDPRIKFYDFFVSSYDKFKKNTGTEWMQSTLPQIEKTKYERVQGKQDAKTAFKESIKTGMVKRPDDIEKGQYEIRDEKGQVVNHLPIFYTNKIEQKNQSYDLATLLQSYGNMSINYSKKSEIIDEMELAKFLVEHRKYKETKHGQPVKQYISKLFRKATGDKELTKDDMKILLKDKLNDYFKMSVYGQREVDEGTIKAFGVEFDVAKLANALNKYTALNMLGLNVITGVGNVLLGETLQIIDAFAGEHYNMKDYSKARLFYHKNLPGIVGDIGQRKKNNVISLMLEQWNILNDYNSSDYMKNNRLKRAMGSNTLFFTMHAGEHFMQTTVMLAMLRRLKPKKDGKIMTDRNGRELTMLDVISTKNGQLIIEEGVENFGIKEQADFVFKVKRLLSRLHGEYSQNGKAAFQKLAIGRMAMMFRKFVVTGWKRRWDKRKWNELSQQYTEGNYVSFGKFVFKMIKDLKMLNAYLGGTEWKKMTTHEKANIKRSIGEILALATTFILVNALSKMEGEDDEDERLLHFLQYQGFRLSSELMFFVNPVEAQRILRSPAASISAVSYITKFFGLTLFPPFAGYDRYVQGPRKGQLKLWKPLESMTPIYKQYKRLENMEDQLSFFSSLNFGKNKDEE